MAICVARCSPPNAARQRRAIADIASSRYSRRCPSSPSARSRDRRRCGSWGPPTAGSTLIFGYSNSEQSFVVPTGATLMQVTVVGAAGGSTYPRARPGITPPAVVTVPLSPLIFRRRPSGATSMSRSVACRSSAETRPDRVGSTGAATAAPVQAAGAARPTCGPCRAVQGHRHWHRNSWSQRAAAEPVSAAPMSTASATCTAALRATAAVRRLGPRREHRASPAPISMERLTTTTVDTGYVQGGNGGGGATSSAAGAGATSARA